ncbi:MAG: hypothetical protein ACYCW6_10490 [Candidatus Xenobia bacterium]
MINTLGTQPVAASTLSRVGTPAPGITDAVEFKSAVDAAVAEAVKSRSNAVATASPLSKPGSELRSGAEWVKDNPAGTVRALGLAVMGAAPVLGPLAHLVTAFPTQCAGFGWPGDTSWGTIGTGAAGIATNVAGYLALGTHPLLGAASLLLSGALLVRNNYVANAFHMGSQ